MTFLGFANVVTVTKSEESVQCETVYSHHGCAGIKWVPIQPQLACQKGNNSGSCIITDIQMAAVPSIALCVSTEACKWPGAKAPNHQEAPAPTPPLVSLYFMYMHESENMIQTSMQKVHSHCGVAMFHIESDNIVYTSMQRVQSHCGDAMFHTWEWKYSIYKYAKGSKSLRRRYISYMIVKIWYTQLC